jgi:hypothetical protein
MGALFLKLHTKSEGLDDALRVTPDLSNHIDRGLLSIEDLILLLQETYDTNEAPFECAFFLEAHSRVLRLELTDSGLLASNPRDLNYQNISIPEEDLETFLLDYFVEKSSTNESVEQDRTGTRDRIVAVLVFTTLIAALSYMTASLTASRQFMPPPKISEELDPNFARTQLNRVAGVFVTALEDGEMMIEISPEGTFALYDLQKAEAMTTFSLEQVDAGECRLTRIGDSLAVVTGNNFVFQPIDKNGLVFLQRYFKRIASSIDQVPFVQIP